MEQKTIGVIVSKGPGAKAPYIQDEEVHKAFLKSIYNAIGKKSPWEIWEEEEALSANNSNSKHVALCK